MKAEAMPVDSNTWAGRGCLDRAAIGRYVVGRRTPEGGYCFYRTPQWAVEEPNDPRENVGSDDVGYAAGGPAREVIDVAFGNPLSHVDGRQPSGRRRGHEAQA